MGDVVEYVQRDQKERVAQCSQGKREGQERPHRGGSRKHLLNKKSASLRFASTCFGHSITDPAFSLALFCWLVPTCTLKIGFEVLLVRLCISNSLTLPLKLKRLCSSIPQLVHILRWLTME